jgi:fatty-acyl-CoA synthase
MRNDPHLSARPKKFKPLTPLDFLDRALRNQPDSLAVIWREHSWNYSQFARIVGRLRNYISGLNVETEDVVSVMAGNRPEMLAAHYAIPAAGAVLNSINTRLDSETVGWILQHSESKLLLCDEHSAETAKKAAENVGIPIQVFSEKGSDGLDILNGEDVNLTDLSEQIKDEWAPIALNYTSGTTDNPKGVVLHHRGAYLNSLGNIMALGFGKSTKYLWTLPMFHCNGWCHTWAITAAGGTHVCLDRIDPGLIVDCLQDQEITHFSCAPVVLYLLLGHSAIENFQPLRRITVATGGASPTSRLIESMEKLGFDFIHLYGLTESFGPTSLRLLSAVEEKLETEEKANLLARQGVRHITANQIQVLDEVGKEVPWDGSTSGEIVLSGNTLFSGYYRNQDATSEALRNDGFHTGDIAVVHPNGDFEIRDRIKDIIISGGENISSLEVEAVLHNHPQVSIAAVVAKPDEYWGEVPCAFIELNKGEQPSHDELRQHCRGSLAGFKIPKFYIFCDLPKTATGKIRKVELREQAKDI